MNDSPSISIFPHVLKSVDMMECYLHDINGMRFNVKGHVCIVGRNVAVAVCQSKVKIQMNAEH